MEFLLKYVIEWIRWTAVLSPVLPFTVGAWHKRKTKSVQYKLVLALATLGVLTEAVYQITILLGTKNNLWVSYFSTFLVFSVLSSIYYHSYDKISWKRVIPFGALLLLALISYEAFYVEGGVARLNSASRVAGNAMIISMALAYFYKVANDAHLLYLDRDPMFLFSCAVLIYFAGSSTTYAIFNDALAISHDAARVCLATKNVLTIMFYSSLVLILRRMAAWERY